jgi:hypothetical protein
VELGVAEVQAWDMARGIPHLREALALASDPVTRGEIAMVLAGGHRGMSDFTGAVDVLEAELARLDGANADMARILESAVLQTPCRTRPLTPPCATGRGRRATSWRARPGASAGS